MAGLTAAGFSPRRCDRGEYVVVETEVTGPLPAEDWEQLYELLASVASWGGKWGLVSTKGSRIAHASIRKVPAAYGRRGPWPSALGS